jgi:hypothetical protein
VAKDKRDRRENFMGSLSKQRFEEEVAEEIGVSLKGDKKDRPGRRAETGAWTPGSPGTVSPPGWDVEKPNRDKDRDKDKETTKGRDDGT